MKLWWWGILVGMYVVSRIYIWEAKPTEFTQIIAVYMPYAHLWASGIQPYLEQWYEYPPLTIPLFYVPHLLDMSTLSWGWHINYAIAYRGLILLMDVFLFLMIIFFLRRWQVRPKIIATSLIFYTLATAKAHDFIYDSMDLVFAFTMVAGLISDSIFRGFGASLLHWLGYFAGIGLKLINAPLGLAYLALERQHRKRVFIAAILSGLIIWGLPLFWYRSALSVMFVYHAKRDLQVESVPAQISSLINRFTNTEHYENQYQSMAIIGPISKSVSTVYTGLFGLYIIGFSLWLAAQAYKTPAAKAVKMRIAITMAYLFGFMLWAKVLSTPYHLWMIPIISLFPFKNWKQQWVFTGLTLINIIISMTKIPNLAVGILNVHVIIGLVRSVILGVLWIESIKLVTQINRVHKS